MSFAANAAVPPLAAPVAAPPLPEAAKPKPAYKSADPIYFELDLSDVVVTYDPLGRALSATIPAFVGGVYESGTAFAARIPNVDFSSVTPRPTKKGTKRPLVPAQEGASDDDATVTPPKPAAKKAKPAPKAVTPVAAARLVVVTDPLSTAESIRALIATMAQLEAAQLYFATNTDVPRSFFGNDSEVVREVYLAGAMSKKNEWVVNLRETAETVAQCAGVALADLSLAIAYDVPTVLREDVPFVLLGNVQLINPIILARASLVFAAPKLADLAASPAYKRILEAAQGPSAAPQPAPKPARKRTPSVAEMLRDGLPTGSGSPCAGFTSAIDAKWDVETHASTVAAPAAPAAQHVAAQSPARTSGGPSPAKSTVSATSPERDANGNEVVWIESDSESESEN